MNHSGDGEVIDILPEKLIGSCRKIMNDYHIPASRMCLPFFFEFCLVCVALIGSIISQQCHDASNSLNVSKKYAHFGFCFKKHGQKLQQ